MSGNGRGFRGPSRQSLSALLHMNVSIGRSPRPACEIMSVTQCAGPRHKRLRRQAIRSPIALSNPFKAPPGIGSAIRRSAALQRSWRGWAWCGKTPRAAHICHGFAARHCSRAASLIRIEAVWRTTPIWHADCPLSLSLVSSLKTRRFCKHTPAPGAFHGHTPPKPQAFMP